MAVVASESRGLRPCLLRPSSSHTLSSYPFGLLLLPAAAAMHRKRSVRLRLSAKKQGTDCVPAMRLQLARLAGPGATMTAKWCGRQRCAPALISARCARTSLSTSPLGPIAQPVEPARPATSQLAQGRPIALPVLSTRISQRRAHLTASNAQHSLLLRKAPQGAGTGGPSQLLVVT